MANEGNASFLRHEAYVHIKEQLVAGKWGLNDRISEKTVADELGISRTPVREAIRKMIIEGLLYQVPSSGTFVTKPDRQSIVEMFEVRLALEGMAVEKATELIRAPEVRELLRHFTVMRNAGRAFRDSGESYMNGEILERFLASDRAMHKVLLLTSDNRLASNIVQNGRIQTLIYGLHTYDRDLHHIAITLRAHGRVLLAIKQRDASSARLWMEKHIRNSMCDALRAYDRQASAAHRSSQGDLSNTDMT
ncbi:GntR family transcriptional regulator [Adhaeretor mobilis]|uniref:Putative HTH-type transcriptional regulator YdfH n=1 Tax=Adhaeretor mobilis TaxID=1930276 RepID=A0A517MUE1_9BACT|nr:GntR family transcriptional regulator [Adhaeretor mobilis]QDS98501.1 putative HTH-type transcriptional regulator YdfH [Adhaeretor mobilis]